MSDESLTIGTATMADFRKGSQRAFEAIYRMNYQRMLLLARRFTGSVGEAEDIVADAFLRLWRQHEDQQDITSINAFLYNSVKHKCFDFLRHASVKKQHHVKLVHILETSDEPDFSVEMVRLELVKMIYDQAALLPEKMREVFLMTYQLGMKPAEIAEQLGISVKTVKNQRLNAVNMLKDLLRDKPLLLAVLLLLEAKSQFFS